MFASNKEAIYYLLLCRELGSTLNSIVFLTYLERGRSRVRKTSGHWVAVEHDLKDNSIVVWDPLQGRDRTGSLTLSDHQISEQWMATNIFSSESASNVRQRRLRPLPLLTFMNQRDVNAPLPPVLHTFLNREKIGVEKLTEATSAATAFWALAISFTRTLGATVHNIPSSIVWIKMSLNELQLEYRRNGVRRQTVQRIIDGFEFPLELSKDGDFQGITIVRAILFTVIHLH